MISVELFGRWGGLSVEAFGISLYIQTATLAVLSALTVLAFTVRWVNRARVARRSRRMYAAAQTVADSVDATGADGRLTW